MSLDATCKTQATISEADLPLDPLLSGEAQALALIVGTEGPSYRPVGAAMALDGAGRRWGNLSSGCIEEDVALHAAQAIENGMARQLRYGQGSPFRDLELPCGGGLDILILPMPDRDVLRQIHTQLGCRAPVTLYVDPEAGRISAVPMAAPLHVTIQPELRFLVFGKGPEAQIFAATAHLAGYQVALYSPSIEPVGQSGGLESFHLTSARWPDGVLPDAYTAVTLFFHDHEWEPPLLEAALRSPAFFVGAQGSLRSHQARCAALVQRGLSAADIGRISAPFGLIPSARDPRTLAVSVLADVLAQAMAR
ncbi:XdhC family protein [Rhodobacteraceae bacterium]|nr:XdhC family protein [Paracoccaceae bacterium]